MKACPLLVEGSTVRGRCGCRGLMSEGRVNRLEGRVGALTGGTLECARWFKEREGGAGL